MDKSRFSIFEAAKQAYIFVGKEWFYLLRAGMLPVGAQITTTLFVQFDRQGASPIESYLWELPAAVLFAWFMFLETRLLLLGERLDRLPLDPAYLADRQHAMKVSVLTAVLFNMSMAAAQALLLALGEQSQTGTSPLINIGGFFLIGAIVWGVRFGIVPTLAAVHHPIRPVLRQTEGMLFSLRLMGMGILCVMPITFVLWLVTAPLLGGAETDAATKVTDAQQITFTAATALLSLVFASLISAGVAYALKQILGSGKAGITS